MPRTLYANCPRCSAQNSIAVRVGRKTTCREAGCAACGKRYDYSAWVLRREDGMVIHQVELVELDVIMQEVRCEGSH